MNDYAFLKVLQQFIIEESKYRQIDLIELKRKAQDKDFKPTETEAQFLNAIASIKLIRRKIQKLEKIIVKEKKILKFYKNLFDEENSS